MVDFSTSVVLTSTMSEYFVTSDAMQFEYNQSDFVYNDPLTLLESVSTNDIQTTTHRPEMEAYVPAIPEADVKLFSHITRSFVNPGLGVVGFIGNILGVGVLWRQAKQQKQPIFWYLCALTIADIMFLGLAVVDGIPRIVSAFDQELSKYLIAHFRTGLTWIDNTLLHTARYIVVALSCDRLISVVKPFEAKHMWFAKYPLRIVLSCLIFNLIIGSPLVIFSTVISKEIGNQTEYIFTFRNYDNFMAQWWIAEAIVHNFIPMLVLVPINIAIPLRLYKSSARFRQSLSTGRAKQQGKVTATVLSITIMYTLLSIPLLVMKIFQYVNPDFNMQGKYRLYFWFMADLSKCLAYTNAAIDFPIYFLASDNYRFLFKSMYCQLCNRNRKLQKYQSSARDVASKETVFTSYD